MATWLAHPRYTVVRDRLVEYLRSPNYRFRRAKPVAFLCGGAASTNRDTLRNYLRCRLPTLDIFYAERVWELLAEDSTQSALEMESHLAELADIVIVIVESPGTFAELGAFSLVEPLRKKLLPIVDQQHHNQPSFICTGPLRWVDRESFFAPTICVPFPRILAAADQLEERIRRIPRQNTVKITDLASSPKHLVFFVADLVAVIYPATMGLIEDYLGRIAPSILASSISLPTLVGLATALGLLRATRIRANGREETIYSPGSPKAVERPFHHRRFLDLPSQRADHVSVLLTIREAKAVLDGLNKTS